MARREFGGADQVKERCRDERRWSWMRVSGRTLSSPFARCAVLPALPLTAVLTLALGIAANVIVFGVLQAMILRPLNVPNGERVMTLAHSASAFPFIS